ncbi:MAG: hypothetical protein PVF58_19400 [Candidatus Methanofastidiosia archaeon]|jgi:hypothetical protein
MDVNKILEYKKKTLNEVSDILGVESREILETLIQRERTPAMAPSPKTAPQKEKKEKKKKKEVQQTRSDEQLAEYFLNRLQKESLSVLALNNKYKVNDKERVEQILEELVDQGKLTKRESKNKKGRYVYEAPEE